MTVTAIELSADESRPLTFSVKTKTGQLGYVFTGVSGTNHLPQLDDMFESCFFTQDPKITYHFTPALWQTIKAGATPIGMPVDAFKLVMGAPKAINTTQTAKTISQQWVYGNNPQIYYYFTNGKLTAIQY